MKIGCTEESNIFFNDHLFESSKVLDSTDYKEKRNIDNESKIECDETGADDEVQNKRTLDRGRNPDQDSLSDSDSDTQFADNSSFFIFLN